MILPQATHFFASLPKGLWEHLPTFLPARKRANWAAKTAWLVSSIAKARSRRWAAADDYVPLFSPYLEKVLGKDRRRKVIELLTRHRIIEERHIWRRATDDNKGQSMGYRLAPEWRDKPVVSVRVKCPTTAKAIRRAYAVSMKRIESDELLSGLKRHYDRVEVRKGAPPVQELEYFRKGEEWFHRDTTAGRLHNPIVSLPRWRRQWVLLEGREVYSVDTVNSQPLLLAMVVKGLGGRVREGGSKAEAYLYVPRIDECLNDDDLSVEAYVADCLAGRLYETLQSKTRLTRESVKLGVMRTIYGVPLSVADRQGWSPNRSEDNLAVGEAFRQLYPGVYGLLDALWVKLGRGGLPVLMQRLESWLFLDRIAARLLRQHPAMPFLTAHDSILCHQESIGTARAVIEDEYRAAFGVVPALKDAPWSVPHSPRRVA